MSPFGLSGLCLLNRLILCSVDVGSSNKRASAGVWANIGPVRGTEQLMVGPRKSWNDIRGPGLLIAVAMASAASLGTWSFHSRLTAKAPGETHCYKDTCHRVYTLDETRRMIGQTTELVATHYDVPGVDKFNTGELTSSGERFDANNPGRTSASNFPDGTELLVWNPVTKRAAHVRVNDFGPFWGKRTLDVTPASQTISDLPSRAWRRCAQQ